MDMSNLVPVSLCSSHQNCEVNFKSWSDTIDSGMPYSCTISHIYKHAMSDVILLTLSGTRCIILVNQQSTTHK